MSTKIIVSYDGTDNDHDALALGRIFANAGAEVSLAYVRHTHEPESEREALAQNEAEELLERGGALLGSRRRQRHVVSDRSTREGLWALASRSAPTSSSSARTPTPLRATSRSAIRRSACRGRSGRRRDRAGRACAALRAHLQRVAALADPTDQSVEATARGPCRCAGRRPGWCKRAGRAACRRFAPGGRPGPRSTERRLDAAGRDAAWSVLVLPRGTAVSFGAPVAA